MTAEVAVAMGLSVITGMGVAVGAGGSVGRGVFVGAGVSVAGAGVGAAACRVAWASVATACMVCVICISRFAVGVEPEDLQAESRAAAAIKREICRTRNRFMVPPNNRCLDSNSKNIESTVNFR
jgi:hypothetical protein